MKKIINIHADDFGIGNEITDNILDCINSGSVNSISIVCNTNNFKYGIEKYTSIPKKIRLCLHLNLVEGKPISSKEEVNLIVDKSGEFKYSFLSLWLFYILASKVKKRKISEQIKTEIDNQIDKYKNAINSNTPILIDSHMHFHMIPFIFKSLLGLHEKHKIDFIRNPLELKYFYGFTKMKNYLALNFIKNILLNHLSKKSIRRAKELGIKTNDFFVGVLSTGRMSYKDVDSALSSIQRKQKPKSIDILFHPGGVKNKESIDWTKKNAFLQYYSSIERKNESQVIKDDNFKSLIQKYEVIFNN